MSRTLPANFLIESDKTSKQPIARVTFAGITRGYVSGTYSSISANDRKFLRGANFNLQKFDFLTAPFARIGQTDFEIADKGDDVTSVLNGDNLHGVDITTALGFQDIGSADFLSLPVTTIKKIKYDEKNISYNFISEDARKLLQQSIYIEPKTTLINDGTHISETDTTIVSDSTTGFITPANVPANLDVAGPRGWILIGSELISYTGIATATDFTGCARGQKRTSATTHQDNESIMHVIGFPDSRPHDVLLHILMTTRDASGHAYYDLANFDAGYGQLGNIALTSTEVDIEQIQQIGHKTNHWGNNGIINLFITKKTNVITFIEDMILKPMGWYMYLGSNGKLKINSLSRLHIDDVFSSAVTLTNADFKSVSMETREDLMINTIKTLDPLDGAGGRRVPVITQEAETYQLDESVTAYGATQKPLELETTLFLVA